MPKIVDQARNFVKWVRSAPDRATTLYPRLMQLGVIRTGSRQTILKATLPNLRTFSRTPTARRAINAIKNPIKDLEWEIVPKKGVTTNSEIKRQIRMVTNCFTMPNNDDSFSTFIEKIIEDFLVVSAGCYEQQDSVTPSSDHPIYMWPVDASTIRHNALWDGDPSLPRYAQVVGNGNQAWSGGDMATLFDDEIVYLAPNPSNENPFGYGPLEIAAKSISRQLGAAEYAGNVASNAQPLNLIHLGDVGQEGVTAFRTFWRNEVEGQGSTPITGGKDQVSVERLSEGKDEALYLKWQEFLILEIARAFDLSPAGFGLQREQARTGGNAQQASVTDSRDYRQAVVPMALKIKDFINRKTILGKLGFTQIELDWPELRQEDRLKQAEIDEIRYQNNEQTPNEARLARGEEPLDNEFADLLYADVQIAIGEARRGPETSPSNPSKLRNQPPRKLRQVK